VTFLVQALKAASPERRQMAADALRDIEDPRVTEAMVSALEDFDAGVRGRAARALDRRQWRPRSSKEQIWYCISRGQIHQSAAFGPEAIEPLARVVQGGPYSLRIAAIQALGRIPDERVLNLLIPALSSVDHAVCVAAVEALAGFGGPAAAEAVASTLQHPDHRVRLAGAEALAQLETRNAVQALTALLNDSMWDVRRAAVVALGKLQDPQAIHALIAALSDGDADVREAAIRAIGRLRDPEAIGPLVLALVDTESSVRQAAAFSLHLIDTKWQDSEHAQRVIPELRAATSSDDTSVCYAGVAVLRQLGDSERPVEAADAANLATSTSRKQRRVCSIFMELLADSDRDVRLAAAQSLGRLGDKRAAAALMTALSDRDDAVKLAASASLEALKA
jgi:HEAT repeat protein